MHLSTFCRSWSKIYSSNGTELHNHDGCDHNDHRVFGEIVEVSFEGSDFLTIKLRTDRQGSFVRSEFVILEEGKSLKSGKVPLHTSHIFTKIRITSNQRILPQLQQILLFKTHRIN